MRNLKVSLSNQSVTLLAIAFCLFGISNNANGQTKKAKEKQLATIQGVIKNDNRKEFSVNYEEIKTSLRKVVVPPLPPFPNGWKEMKPEDQQAWLKKFTESDRGKAFIKKREKMINEAPSFDVKYNDDGDFVVYDVPPGDYGLQGRVDKEINGVTYGFEVFARIKVLDDVDQIKLQPIPVEITPLFKTGQSAPPLALKTSKGEDLNYDLDAYKDHYIFLNFLNTADGAPGYQEQVQKMYAELGKSHKVKLISIVLDKDQNKAIKWLVGKKYTGGSYGFTKGWDHETVEDYGVRSTPSGWLIGPNAERKILMTQYEFFRLARVKNSVAEIVRDRIEGKDTPTLAEPPKPAAEDSPEKK